MVVQTATPCKTSGTDACVILLPRFSPPLPPQLLLRCPPPRTPLVPSVSLRHRRHQRQCHQLHQCHQRHQYHRPNNAINADNAINAIDAIDPIDAINPIHPTNDINVNDTINTITITAAATPLSYPLLSHSRRNRGAAPEPQLLQPGTMRIHQRIQYGTYRQVGGSGPSSAIFGANEGEVQARWAPMTPGAERRHEEEEERDHR